jgi:hypothetical protein
LCDIPNFVSNKAWSLSKLILSSILLFLLLLLLLLLVSVLLYLPVPVPLLSPLYGILVFRLARSSQLTRTSFSKRLNVTFFNRTASTYVYDIFKKYNWYQTSPLNMGVSIFMSILP